MSPSVAAATPPRPASLIQVAPLPPQSEPQAQEVPSPPRSIPQPQETLTDVSGQITDPNDLGTSSVILPDQTVTVPPQRKVPITESLPMNLSINSIITPGNFQPKIFHRQPQPIKL